MSEPYTLSQLFIPFECKIILSLFRIGLFAAAHTPGRPKRPPIPKTYQTYSTMMKMAQLYLPKEHSKKCIPLDTALLFCCQQFLSGNQKSFLYLEIKI